jgi:hypothetical protein
MKRFPSALFPSRKIPGGNKRAYLFVCFVSDFVERTKTAIATTVIMAAMERLSMIMVLPPDTAFKRLI